MSIGDIKARLAAATPGPWEQVGSDVYESQTTHGDVVAECGLTGSDARFIAHAPQDIAQLVKALEGALNVHRPRTLWEPYDGAGHSYETREDAIEAASDLDLGVYATSPASFDICTECGRIEADQLDEYGEDWGYRESIYPCPTVRAITEALDS